MWPNTVQIEKFKYISTCRTSDDLHPLAYEKPPPKYSAECLLMILLDPKIDSTKICCTWPIAGIESSATFMIDVTKLKHQDDVCKDFFGKWNRSGSHPPPFKARVTDDDEMEVEKCAPGVTGDVFYLRRLRSHHPSNPDFQ